MCSTQFRTAKISPLSSSQLLTWVKNISYTIYIILIYVILCRNEKLTPCFYAYCLLNILQLKMSYLKKVRKYSLTDNRASLKNIEFWIGYMRLYCKFTWSIQAYVNFQVKKQQQQKINITVWTLTVLCIKCLYIRYIL